MRRNTFWGDVVQGALAGQQMMNNADDAAWKAKEREQKEKEWDQQDAIERALATEPTEVTQAAPAYKVDGSDKTFSNVADAQKEVESIKSSIEKAGGGDQDVIGIRPVDRAGNEVSGFRQAGPADKYRSAMNVLRNEGFGIASEKMNDLYKKNVLSEMNEAVKSAALTGDWSKALSLYNQKVDDGYQARIEKGADGKMNFISVGPDGKERIANTFDDNAQAAAFFQSQLDGKALDYWKTAVINRETQNQRLELQRQRIADAQRQREFNNQLALARMEIAGGRGGKGSGSGSGSGGSKGTLGESGIYDAETFYKAAKLNGENADPAMAQNAYEAYTQLASSAGPAGVASASNHATLARVAGQIARGDLKPTIDFDENTMQWKRGVKDATGVFYPMQQNAIVPTSDDPATKKPFFEQKDVAAREALAVANLKERGTFLGSSFDTLKEIASDNDKYNNVLRVARGMKIDSSGKEIPIDMSKKENVEDVYKAKVTANALSLIRNYPDAKKPEKKDDGKTNRFMNATRSIGNSMLNEIDPFVSSSRYAAGVAGDTFKQGWDYLFKNDQERIK